MGFLDKAKEAAEKAMQQGQAKVGSYQQGRSESELYRTLGEAFYSEQRGTGDRQAVQAGLDAVDAHFAAIAAAAAAGAQPSAAQPPAAPPASSGQGAPASTASPGAPTAPGGTASGGNFTLDDL